MNIYFESNLDNYDENIPYNPDENDYSLFWFNFDLGGITFNFNASMWGIEVYNVTEFCSKVINCQEASIVFNNGQGTTISYRPNMVNFHNMIIKSGYSVLNINIPLENQEFEMKFKRSIEGFLNFAHRYGELHDNYYAENEDNYESEILDSEEEDQPQEEDDVEENPQQ